MTKDEWDNLVIKHGGEFLQSWDWGVFQESLGKKAVRFFAGDLWDYLWFVPAPDSIKMANKLDGGRLLGFVAGRKRKGSNKWDDYLIDKRDLANQVIAQMKRI